MDLKLFTCNSCGQLEQNAFESFCCGALYCSTCTKVGITSNLHCAVCKFTRMTTGNLESCMFVWYAFEKIEVSCRCCNHHGTLSKLSHSDTCAGAFNKTRINPDTIQLWCNNELVDKENKEVNSEKHRCPDENQQLKGEELVRLHSVENNEDFDSVDNEDNNCVDDISPKFAELDDHADDFNEAIYKVEGEPSNSSFDLLFNKSLDVISCKSLDTSNNNCNDNDKKNSNADNNTNNTDNVHINRNNNDASDDNGNVDSIYLEMIQILHQEIFSLRKAQMVYFPFKVRFATIPWLLSGLTNTSIGTCTLGKRWQNLQIDTMVPSEASLVCTYQGNVPPLRNDFPLLLSRFQQMQKLHILLTNYEFVSYFISSDSEMKTSDMIHRRSSASKNTTIRSPTPPIPGRPYMDKKPSSYTSKQQTTLEDNDINIYSNSTQIQTYKTQSKLLYSLPQVRQLYLRKTFHDFILELNQRPAQSHCLSEKPQRSAFERKLEQLSQMFPHLEVVHLFIVYNGEIDTLSIQKMFEPYFLKMSQVVLIVKCNSCDSNSKAKRVFINFSKLSLSVNIDE